MRGTGAMKRVMNQLMVATFMLASVMGTGANPNDLAGGVFITHAPVFPVGTGCWMGWCGCYYQGAVLGIESCEEQINNMPITSYHDDPTLFYVVAAWSEPKIWCGTEFGISSEFDELFYFIEYGPCLENSLEISTVGWPGAGEGTAVVATDTPWEGNFVPTYFFLGYTYTDTRIQLDVDPAQDFAGTGNCEIPPQLWDAVCLGAVGTGSDPGVYCCPEVITPPEACCFEDGSCEMLLHYDCEISGGIFFGGSCDPNPCPGGTIGACCIETGECFSLGEEDCSNIGGDYLGDGTSCEPNPCTPTPVNAETWGGIKALYRHTR